MFIEFDMLSFKHDVALQGKNMNNFYVCQDNQLCHKS